MLQQAADGVQGHFAQARVAAAGEQRLASFQSEMCVCMPLPLSPNSGLGMNVTVLSCFLATFLMMYL